MIDNNWVQYYGVGEFSPWESKTLRHEPNKDNLMEIIIARNGDSNT